jgi:hypothetical protein
MWLYQSDEGYSAWHELGAGLLMVSFVIETTLGLTYAKLAILLATLSVLAFFHSADSSRRADSIRCIVNYSLVFFATFAINAFLCALLLICGLLNSACYSRSCSGREAAASVFIPLVCLFIRMLVSL